MSRLSYFQDIIGSLLDSYNRGRDKPDDRTLEEQCDALLSARGELSGNQLAQSILRQVNQAGTDEQLAFFEMLATRYDIDPDELTRASEAYAKNQSIQNWRRLTSAAEPGRLELLRRLNRMALATGQLVQMREKLLPLLRGHPTLKRVDHDFEVLFRSWFNQGFLVLRRIDWNTPANILEKIIQYEAVHAIDDWEDLRNRLQPEDRRCFAFFHPAVPNDPLIFVEVALTRELPVSVQAILQIDREVLGQDEADTAVFYSISNCQAGLRGVSFGNFLIKQVARELAQELPGLKVFRTLSPVPSLMSWVGHAESFNLNEVPEPIDEPIDAEALQQMLELARAVADGKSPADHETGMLRRLVAWYLFQVRGPDQQPLDPVARFHLGNGASLSQVLVNADLSEKGLKHSAGTMVSYLYDLDKVERNHEAYAINQIIPATREVENLLPSKGKSTERPKNREGN